MVSSSESTLTEVAGLPAVSTLLERSMGNFTLLLFRQLPTSSHLTSPTLPRLAKSTMNVAFFWTLNGTYTQTYSVSGFSRTFIVSKGLMTVFPRAKIGTRQSPL